MSRLRTELRRWTGAVLFSAAVKPYAILPPGQTPSAMSLRLMQLAWGNPGYTAGRHYLHRVCELAATRGGPVLECGSGLTTILLGLLAKRNGFTITSLEHNAQWHERITQRLEHLDLQDVVSVHLTQLKSYGQFDWYDLDSIGLVDTYRLVVCDGPPGKTRGGRVGLVPVMGDRLADDAVILLDDTHRKREQRVVDMWRRRRPLTYHQLDQTGSCAELRLTQTA